MKYLPEAVVPTAHHWLILHGRYVCTARNPKCAQCGLNGLCKESLKAVPENDKEQVKGRTPVRLNQKTYRAPENTT